MTRNTAREIAAHLSYELSFTDKTVEELLQERLTSEAFAELAEEDSLYTEAPNAKQVAYITRLVTGVNEHAAELDGYIAKYAKNWKFSRIPLVASAIMRVAMYEILYMRGGGDRQKIRDAGNREIYQRNSGQLRAGRDLPVSISTNRQSGCGTDRLRSAFLHKETPWNSATGGSTCCG